MKNEQEQPERIEQKKTVIHPKFNDLKSSYLHWMNYLPENPYQEYIAKKKTISIGKDLLPINGDTDVKQIYDEATLALKNAKPSQRNTDLKAEDIAGDKYFRYTLKSEDAGNCQVEGTSLDNMLMDFKNQQYESIIGKLQEIDDKIFHVLIKNSIIKQHIPTINDMLDKKIEERYIKTLKGE